MTSGCEGKVAGHRIGNEGNAVRQLARVMSSLDGGLNGMRAFYVDAEMVVHVGEGSVGG